MRVSEREREKKEGKRRKTGAKAITNRIWASSSYCCLGFLKKAGGEGGAARDSIGVAGSLRGRVILESSVEAAAAAAAELGNGGDAAQLQHQQRVQQRLLRGDGDSSTTVCENNDQVCVVCV